MKFAHMADLHLGGWRDPELEKLNEAAFEKAIAVCIAERVDFILVSGDFFDTSMPPFDTLDLVSRKLSEVKKAGIPVYSIAGSHDFSPSGKTILKVLENAELITNVARGKETGGGKLGLDMATDPKTGARIVGVFGRKGALEEEFYRNIDLEALDASCRGPGYKIFLFHSAIKEHLPAYLKEAQAMPISLLPPGFDYYAGGHIHHRSEHEYGHGKVVMPGAIFPCNFQELERHGAGGFYIVDVDSSGRSAPRFIELKEAEVRVIKADADNKSAKDVEATLEEAVSKLDGEDYILLMRVFGTLKEGKPTDIDFRRLSEQAYEQGALVVRRSTGGLSSVEYAEVKVSTDTVEDLEERIIKEHLGQSGMDVAKEKELVGRLLRALDTEKTEGETNAAFEGRVVAEGEDALSKK